MPPRPTFGDTIEQSLVGALLAELADSTDVEPWLALLDRAVDDPSDPRGFEAGAAALDALVGSAQAFTSVSADAGAFRSRDHFDLATKRLTRAWERAAPSEGAKAAPEQVALRGLIARAVHELAMFAGDEAAAKTWAGRRGCATEATVVGPLASEAFLGLDSPPVVARTGPLGATYPGLGPFAAKVSPETVVSAECELWVGTAGILNGTREVAMDLEVARETRVTFALDSSAAATVDVGGMPLLRSTADALRGAGMRFGDVVVPAGRTRVVVKVARRDAGARLELDAWGDDGAAIALVAPKVGDAATGVGTSPQAFGLVDPGASARWSLDGARAGTEPASLALTAAAMGGLGARHRAEHLLEGRAKPALVDLPKVELKGGLFRNAAAWKEFLAQQKERAKAFPRAELATELLFARAASHVRDLPPSRLAEELRASAKRLLHYFPRAWEVRLLEASNLRDRKSGADGSIEALRALGLESAEVEEGLFTLEVGAADPMALASIAVMADEFGLVDVAESAYAKVAEAAPQSPLAAELDDKLHLRVGADLVTTACSGAGPRDELDCWQALTNVGRHQDALTELERLRRLRGAPQSYRQHEISSRLHLGDSAGALAAYDATRPTERRALDLLGFFAATGRTDDARARFERDRHEAADTPYSFLTLSRMLGLSPDPSIRFEPKGVALVEADRKQPFLPGAGTAVLEHTEEYEIDLTGLVHYLGYDLRRVSGTTDVAMGTGILAPHVEGMASSSLLRRRIHKKDGRVLEPDHTSGGMQGDTDLSQLEAGDYVEHLYEGWALPTKSAHLTLDTPDLLPERTSVHHARIDLRRPRAVAMTLWSHPLLGKAEEAIEGDMVRTTWKLDDAKPRSLEANVSSEEQNVGISLGTRTWEQLGATVRDVLAGAIDTDPYVGRWAKQVLADASLDPATADKLALVQALVTASGKKIRSAYGQLTDFQAVYGGSPGSPRMSLELGEGSRAWVLYRALSEIGIPAELALAETRPYTVEGHPARPGRFNRTLVVAKLGAPHGDQWIDADVEGPPLPVGHVSPELRGRMAMLGSGSVVKVEGSAAELSDEIDLRVAVDEQGDAKGTLTLLLRGRSAQMLSDALERVAGSERRELLRDVATSWLPKADVEDASVSSEQGSFEVRLRAEVRLSGFARPLGRDGKTWVLPGFEPMHFTGSGSSTLASQLATSGTRQSALTISSTQLYHLRRRVELPAGATVVVSSTPLEVTHGPLSASRTGKYGSIVEEDFRLSLVSSTVSVADYAAFVERVRSVDDGFLAGIRVSNPTAKAPKATKPQAPPSPTPAKPAKGSKQAPKPKKK